MKKVLFIDFCKVPEVYKICNYFNKKQNEIRYYTLTICKPKKRYQNIYTKSVNTQLDGMEKFYKSIIEQSQFDEILNCYQQMTKTSRKKEELRNIIKKFEHELISNLLIFPIDLAIIWNQFHPISRLMVSVLKKFNIKYIFIEYGILPRTFNLDAQGQMGESWVANSKHFNELAINKYDLLKSYLHSWFLNWFSGGARYKENEVDSKLLYKLQKSKLPIMFFIGSNHYASGMLPVTETTYKFHTPIFSNDSEALKELIKIANKHNFFLIYKPHHLMRHDFDEITSNNFIITNKFPMKLIKKYVDVTITQVSHAGYISLFYSKPLVTLGFLQLKNKNCNYQVNNYDELENKILNAYNKKLTKVMKINFKHHIARIAKFYSYNRKSSWLKISFSKNNLIDMHQDIFNFINGNNTYIK